MMKDQSDKEQKRYLTLRQKITETYESFLKEISPESGSQYHKVIAQLPNGQDPEVWRSYKNETLSPLKSSLMYKNKTPDEKKAFEMLDKLQEYCVKVLVGKSVEDDWLTKKMRQWFNKAP